MRDRDTTPEDSHLSPDMDGDNSKSDINEIQELRNWSTGLMRWVRGPYVRQTNRYTINPVEEDAYFTKEGAFVCYVNDWRPDDPTTGQIWMVVERMRELGWVGFNLRQGCVSGNWTALFSKGKNGLWLAGPETDNPCLAILKAAKATEVKP